MLFAATTPQHLGSPSYDQVMFRPVSCNCSADATTSALRGGVALSLVPDLTGSGTDLAAGLARKAFALFQE